MTGISRRRRPGTFARRVRLVGAVLAAVVGPPMARAEQGDAVPVGAFRIDRHEVSVARFRAFAEAAGLRTSAERAGGGHEYVAGWQRRPGWSYRQPFGAPATPNEPAVHVSWEEARALCAAAGGRLPTATEWRRAAYKEERTDTVGGLERGRTYRYPTGEGPDGMWTRDAGATRHRPVGAGQPGVNGLHDMGGNVWEWLADRQGGQALTAGGSWWYGSAQTEAASAQWKDADFYAVYIGFRCAYG